MRGRATLRFFALATVAGLALALSMRWLAPQQAQRLRALLVENDSPPLSGWHDAVSRAAPSVVSIYADRLILAPQSSVVPADGQPGPSSTVQATRPRLRRSLGSGVIVSVDGYVLTNHHVVAGAGAIQTVLWDGRVTPAQVVGSDPDTDIAVLKLQGEGLPALALDDSVPLRVGDVVLAIGNPFGLGQAVSQGIVSALGRSQLQIATFEDFIQTDAAINRGNSGGALVDARGRLVGINTAAFAQQVPDANGIGFAIPVSTARTVYTQIRTQGTVTRGWLGMDYMLGFSPLGADLRGVVVVLVHADGPAANAGIRPGDVLLLLDGRPLLDPIELSTREASLEPGQWVRIDGERSGIPFRVELRAARRPQPSASALR